LQVCNVTKLHFQANLCKVFAQDKKQQHYCGDLVLGWAVLQKTSSTISEQDFIQIVEKVVAVNESSSS